MGTSHHGYDYGLYYGDGRGWYEQRGSAVCVDVDPRGRPWIINDEHEIWRLDRGRWERFPGAAHDIGIGADDSVWVIGADARAGGYGVYRYNGSGRQISVGSDGAPWVVNRDGCIYRGWGY